MRIRRSVVLLFTSLFCAGSGWAQISPGAIVRYERQGDGVLFHMTNGEIRVQVCAPSVVHIVYSPTAAFPHEPDPNVIQTSWPASKFSANETAQDVTVSTSELRVSLLRKNGTISFTDAEGKMLLHSGGDDGGWRMTPMVVDGRHTYHANLGFYPQSGEAFYGLGQHQAGAWNYSGADVALSQANTNISIPFFVSSLGYGIFWNTASVSRFDDGFAQHLFLDADSADTANYYFLYGPSLDRVIAEYRRLTGQAPLFGKWAYGYWQSKNRYDSQQQLLGIAAQYRQLGIPIDNIVQDWFWWTKMGSFIFNQNYPDPRAMVDTLHQEHFHVMISVWPRFLPGTEPFDHMQEHHWFMAMDKPNATWLPGAGLYDPFDPEARAYYWSLIDDHLFKIGFDAWWLDTTEPESFHERNVMLRSQTAMGSGAEYALDYPLMTTTAVYQGQRGVSDKRVFILTRSASAGMQRNAAAAWSGDTFCTWDTLRRQIPAGLNYSLSGLPYWTTDIGGFVMANPNDPAYRELFVRWFEYGAFCPIFRVHGTRRPNVNELWAYGHQAQTILTKYDNLRYRLMPYIYSTAWRVTHDGYTLMRPLVMDYPGDEIARNVGNQFMFGPSILVNPVAYPGETSRRLYLPAGNWYNFWTGEEQAGGRFITTPSPLETEPLFARAGAIVPMGPFVQYADQEPDAPIELRVYAGADGRFTLYDDDGESYAYEHGAYSTIPVRWDDGTHTLTLGARQGSYPGMPQQRTFNIVWVSAGHGAGVGTTEPADKTVDYSGREISVTR
jgi:alpha-D-xyloside xylohydrolase